MYYHAHFVKLYFFLEKFFNLDFQKYWHKIFNHFLTLYLYWYQNYNNVSFL